MVSTPEDSKDDDDSSDDDMASCRSMGVVVCDDGDAGSQANAVPHSNNKLQKRFKYNMLLMVMILSNRELVAKRMVQRRR